MSSLIRAGLGGLALASAVQGALIPRQDTSLADAVAAAAAAAGLGPAVSRPNQVSMLRITPNSQLTICRKLSKSLLLATPTRLGLDRMASQTISPAPVTVADTRARGHTN